MFFQYKDAFMKANPGYKPLILNLYLGLVHIRFCEKDKKDVEGRWEQEGQLNVSHIDFVKIKALNGIKNHYVGFSVATKILSAVFKKNI
uniref:Uncharacterized protein n=1 Tax=Acanthochromis polyacanthus TaxID=80966 RepID=A0A3Q1EIU2_9TELE